MKNKLFAVLATLALLVVGLACTSKAQTTYPATYAGTANYVCHAASLHPVTSFGQFNCWGVNFFDSYGIKGGTYYFRDDVANRFGLFTADGDVAEPTQYQISQITQVTKFTIPSLVPGEFSFTWTLTDANGVVHTGSVSGTWINHQICGGRGCQYWAPQLVSDSITINN